MERGFGDGFTKCSRGKGLFFSSIQDRKFKHNCISVNLITPLEEETVTTNAILPYLLRRGSKKAWMVSMRFWRSSRKSSSGKAPPVMLGSSTISPSSRAHAGGGRLLLQHPGPEDPA